MVVSACRDNRQALIFLTISPYFIKKKSKNEIWKLWNGFMVKLFIAFTNQKLQFIGVY
jgi:hypothetical protein